MAANDAKQRFPAIYSLLFLLGAGLSFVMLATDTNLRTDFGTMSSGYFLHWYGVLAIAVADLVGAGLLLLVRTRTAVKIGVVGSGLIVVAWLGVTLTYSQVGFASASSFARYLFGITYYGGDIRYLYDALLAVYLLTFLAGGVDLLVTRHAQAASDGTPPSPSSS